jgi:hypothetical protein
MQPPRTSTGAKQRAHGLPLRLVHAGQHPCGQRVRDQRLGLLEEMSGLIVDELNPAQRVPRGIVKEQLCGLVAGIVERRQRRGAGCRIAAIRALDRPGVLSVRALRRHVDEERLPPPVRRVVFVTFGDAIASIVAPGDEAHQTPNGVVLVALRINRPGCVRGLHNDELPRAVVLICRGPLRPVRVPVRAAGESAVRAELDDGRVETLLGLAQIGAAAPYIPRATKLTTLDWSVQPSAITFGHAISVCTSVHDTCQERSPLARCDLTRRLLIS